MPQHLRQSVGITLTRDGEATTYEASLASDAPYVRDGYREVLVCTPAAVDLSRAREGLPLLMHHDREQIAGRVHQIRADGRRVRGTLHLFETAAGREAAAMLRAGHRELSIGYTVNESERNQDGDVIATRWTLLEASVVSIPADAGIGVARSYHMDPHSQAHNAGDNTNTLSRSQRRQQVHDHSVEAERVRAITDTAASYADYVDASMIREAINGGHSAEQFNRSIMDRMQSGAVDARSGAPAIISERGDPADLTRGYSVFRAIMAEVDPAAYLRSAGREKEVTQELRRRGMGTSTAGTLVPMECLLTTPGARRDMSMGGSGYGSNTVQTSVMGEMLLPALRARSIAVGLGVATLTGLTAPLQLPRVSAGASPTWTGENGTATESDVITAVSTLTPKRVSGQVDVSRQLVITSAVGIENMLREDLTNACMGELDKAVFVGTGVSEQPRGVRNTAGIGSVVGGTNGATLIWQHILDLEKSVDDANGMYNPVTCGYAINGSTRSYLKRTSKVAGVAEGLIMGSERIDPLGFGVLNSYACGVSRRLPNDLTKGTGTALNLLLFGDWSQCVLGLFGGGVEIIVDPFTKAASGIVTLTANLYCDVAVRQPASFALMEDAKLS